MRRETRLMKKTTEELIELYEWERGRDNEYDSKKALSEIKRELAARITIMMSLLDDEQALDNPKGVYDRLING